MMGYKKVITNLVFLGFLSSINVASVSTNIIHVHYWEIKPYIYLDEGELKGIYPDIIALLNQDCSTKNEVRFHKYDSYMIFLEQYQIYKNHHTIKNNTFPHLKPTPSLSKQRNHVKPTLIVQSYFNYSAQNNHVKPTTLISQSNNTKSIESLQISNTISPDIDEEDYIWQNIKQNETSADSDVWFPFMGRMEIHYNHLHQYSTLHANGLVMVVHLSKISLMNKLILGFRNCLIPLLVTGIIMLFTGLCVWVFVSFSV